jgi:ComF family protein
MQISVVAKALFDFCYPPACIACRVPLATDAELCTACESSMQALAAAAACDACAKPLPASSSPCPYCRGSGLGQIARVARLSVHEGVIRDLIHRMKYLGDWGVAEMLAGRMFEQPRVRALLGDADVLVPVPLHPFRQVQRGYNQAHLLARRLAKLAGGLKVACPAVRVRNTATQTRLRSHADRMENVRDAFALIRPHHVRSRNVVIVDDVMTTGATLLALERALRLAEPRSLSALVVAIADPRGRGFDLI